MVVKANHRCHQGQQPTDAAGPLLAAPAAVPSRAHLRLSLRLWCLYWLLSLSLVLFAREGG